MSTPDSLGSLDVLIEVGMRLGRSAPTGRVVLARFADAIDRRWIPRPWGDEIAAELDAARAAACVPLSAAKVERALRDAWGADPTDELDELDPEPAAVTPSAQVHRGVLDGSPVAVKVLRPGLAAAVRQDLTLLDGLRAPLAAAFPSLDPRTVIAELRERALEELDLESEAEAQRRFHRALRGHPFLVVPAPIMRLASESVLVSAWIDATPILRLPDADLAAAQLVIFVLGAALSGSMHVDPDPNDVLGLPDGRLAILDFGLTRAVEPGRAAIAAAALDAFADNDAGAFGRALQSLGWLGADRGLAALALVQRVLGELGQPGRARLDVSAVLGVRDRLLEQPRELARLLPEASPPVEDLWPARGVAQLYATIARVGASGAWLELARAALRDGWAATLP